MLTDKNAFKAAMHTEYIQKIIIESRDVVR